MMRAERGFRQLINGRRTALGGAFFRRRRRVRIPLTFVLALTVVLGVWSTFAAHIRTPSAATAADPIVLSINPSNPNLWLCSGGATDCTHNGEGKLVVSDEIANVPAGTHVAGFEFTVYYDRNVVSVSASEGPFLASTGRQTQCRQDQTENSLRMACTSTGSQPGPTGSGVLAYLTLTPNVTIRPTLNNGIRTYLAQSGAELTDALENPILIDQVSGATVLVRALEGDVNKDCRVDVIDEQAESGRYGTSLGMWPYNIWFDLEPPTGDYDIDIKDLQFVYGRDYRTCQGSELPPVPTATPTDTPLPTSTSAATATPLPATATPTPTPGTPVATATPSRTPTATTPTPSATPGTATATATAFPGTSTPRHPTATPVRTTETPSRSATPVAMTATATPFGGISPVERTPTSRSGASPAEITRVPTALPGSGSGPTSGGSSGGMLILILAALLATSGWTAIAGIRWTNGGLAREVLERLKSKARGPRSRH